MMSSTRTVIEQTAKRGDRTAQFCLARICDEGWGCKRDPKLAFRWYVAAAKSGFTDAYYFVGSAYQHGEGVRRSERLAFLWFDRAHKAGDSTGTLAVGVCLYWGRGTLKDRRKGMRHIRACADRGDKDARAYLLWLKEEGSKHRREQ